MDVVVKLEYQSDGYGKKIIEMLLAYIKEQLLDGEEIMRKLLFIPGK